METTVIQQEFTTFEQEQQYWADMYKACNIQDWLVGKQLTAYFSDSPEVFPVTFIITGTQLVNDSRRGLVEITGEQDHKTYLSVQDILDLLRTGKAQWFLWTYTIE